MKLKREEKPTRRVNRWSLLGLSSLAIVIATAFAGGTAGATNAGTNGNTDGTVNATSQTGNNLVIGSGSSTTYSMMLSLDQLYNASPGCTLVVDYNAGVPISGAATPTAQPEDYSCLTPAQAATGGVLDPVFSTVTTTLGAAVSSASSTSISVSSIAGFPTSGTFTITVDSEQMNVTGGQGTSTWTVARGVNGTTAATHSSGATVSYVPLGVVANPQNDVAVSEPPIGSSNGIIQLECANPTLNSTHQTDGCLAAYNKYKVNLQYYTNLAQVGSQSTTITSALTASGTSVAVADNTGFPGSGNFVIKIDSEYMIVTGGQGTNTWTVTRGAEGSAATTHSSGASVAQYAGTGQNINVFNGVSYARSSRAASASGTGDNNGLNFVAYGYDGVDWVHYSVVNNANTASDVSGNILGPSEIQALWKGTVQNWAQVGGGHAPVVVFSAQEGSGTQSTWKSAAGAMGGTDPSSLSNKVNCVDKTGWTSAAGNDGSFTATNLAVGVAPSAANQCAGPVNIFENETGQLNVGSLPAAMTNPNASSPGLNAGATVTGSGSAATYTIVDANGTPNQCSAWYLGCTVNLSTNTYTFVLPTASAVLSDAVFFYSSGLFNHQCVLAGHQNTASSCAGGNFVNYSVDATGHTKFQLGQIGSSPTIPISGTSYSTTVGASTCGTAGTCLPTETSVLETTFQVTRFLYNVYANANSTSQPAATPQTLAYIGETGFICTPRNAVTVDPVSGNTYLSEVQAAILNAGFYPISAGMTSGTVNTTAVDEATTRGGSDPVPAWTSVSASSPYYPYIAPNNGGYSVNPLNGAQVNYPANVNANSDPMGYCIVTSTGVSGATSS